MSVTSTGSSVLFNDGGPGRCYACGQFAGDGHSCPVHVRLTGVAHTLYGAAGVAPAAIHDTGRAAARELGAGGEAPARREDVEDVLVRMRLAADELGAAGALAGEDRRAVITQLDASWAALREGGGLRAREVALLRRLHDRHAPSLAAGDRLDAARRRLREAHVEVGLQTLRRRHGGDPAQLAAAVACREEAHRELGRAEALAAEEPEAGRCPGCGRFAGPGHSCPLPAGLPAADYAAARGEARAKAMLGDLRAAVAAVVDSGQLGRWLDAMASNGLNRWSLNNRMLAVMQLAGRGEDLDRLHLMGFRQWERLGRRVRKGAKAVWILAPVTRRVREQDDAGDKLRAGCAHRVQGRAGVQREPDRGGAAAGGAVAPGPRPGRPRDAGGSALAGRRGRLPLRGGRHPRVCARLWGGDLGVHRPGRKADRRRLAAQPRPAVFGDRA